MENNTTKLESGHLDLGETKIYRRSNNDEQSTVISLSIPLDRELSGIRDLDQCEKIAIDDLENHILTIFQLTEFLSRLIADNEPYKASLIGEFIHTLGCIGKGFPVAQETVRVEFAKYRQQQVEVKENKPLETIEPKPRRKIASIDEDYECLDFDFRLLKTVDIPDLAAALSAILAHPLLPKAMHDGVINGMNSVRDTLTDEQLQTLTDDEGDSLYIGELLEFDEKNRVAAKSQPLDLSKSSPEAISQSLVDLMSNPNLPDNIRACLEVELPNVQKGE